jgi:hypothetical protein
LFGRLWSLHDAGANVQPGVGVAVTEYTPDSSCPVVRWPPSVRPNSNDLPLGRVKTKPKLVKSPVGCVCTLTMIFVVPEFAWTPATASVMTTAAIDVQVKRRRARRADLLGAVLLVI